MGWKEKKEREKERNERNLRDGKTSAEINFWLRHWLPLVWLLYTNILNRPSPSLQHMVLCLVGQCGTGFM